MHAEIHLQDQDQYHSDCENSVSRHLKTRLESQELQTWQDTYRYTPDQILKEH